MKKILLLLILSFFSAQSFAGSCPDGSEPVKSISADGTYFVFNCGGGNEQASSSSITNSRSTIKAIKYESFIDTNTSSSCKELDKKFYRNSYNKCSIIAVLDIKPNPTNQYPLDWFKNVWQTSELLINRVNKDGNLEIVGKAENRQVDAGEITDGKKAQMLIASIVVNTEELGSNSVQVIKNPIVELTGSSNRQVMVDVNQDGVTELVIAGMNEDGRSSDSNWREVNYIYNFETEGFSELGKPMYSHDFVAGDLDDDGYDEFIDIGWPGPQGDGVGVCNGKTLKCVYQGDLPNLSVSKTSLSVYPNKKGGILFGNCGKAFGGGSSLKWCWSEVTYKNGTIQLKLLDSYMASKMPDKEVPYLTWQNEIGTMKGSQVSGYKTSERILLLGESYRSHQFDMDDDGDFDTVTYTLNILCIKSADEEAFNQVTQCKEHIVKLIFFRNDDGKFTVSDIHDTDLGSDGAAVGLYNYDINKDGHMDFYIFRDQFNTWETDCHKQFNNIYFGNSDGTFRRPSVEEQSEIFGNYGCEIQSYFFDFEGESYRTFFTHKYSKHFSGTRAVYVGVEKIATKAEKAKRIAEEAAEEAAQAAAEELIEKELAELEAELKAEEELIEKELAELEAELAAEEELIEKELAEENKSSPLFDGRYRFNLFRYEDDEGSMKIGNGFVEIRNGEVIIEKDNRELTTGSIDLYDAFSGQINKEGKVSASMTLDVLHGIDVLELYVFDGSIKDEKIWGDPPYEDSLKAYLLLEAVETVVSSPLFDGRYSFNLFRYHDDEDWQELGNGFVEIRNGEVTIDKDNSDLKTASTDLYDTFSGQIDEKGNVSGSVELAYLFGEDHSDVFTLSGQIDKKIWGDNPRDDFFRVYMILVKK
ncbi:hypothetical protein N8516_00290 [Candidatus Thioglobus sp.]|jgi:hypothetical protein|nr:hypothetical protein [Candidatus Thioglobus sp.]